MTPDKWWYAREKITPELIAEWTKKLDSEGVIMPCKYVHPNICIIDNALSALRMLQKMYKLYALLHIVPHLLLRADKFSAKAMVKLARSIFHNLLFFTTYAFLGKLVWCGVKNYYGSFNPRLSLWLAGGCAATIFIERSNRWPEFAMNVFPRYLESIKPYLRKQHLWLETPLTANIFMAISIGISTSVYFKNPECIKKQFYWLLQILMGQKVESLQQNAADLQISE